VCLGCLIGSFWFREFDVRVMFVAWLLKKHAKASKSVLPLQHKLVDWFGGCVCYAVHLSLQHFHLHLSSPTPPEE